MAIKCHFEGCHKVFKCQSKLKDHLNSHLGITPFECKICLKKFTCKRYHDTHFKSHKENFICESCNKSFTRKHNLKRHLKYCSIIHTCPNCQKIFKKKGCFNNHLVKCEKIKKKEKKSFAFSRKSKELAVCKICKATFSAKRNMLAHVKSIHEKVKFKCEMCEKVFSHNCSLKRHIQNQHFKEK